MYVSLSLSLSLSLFLVLFFFSCFLLEIVLIKLSRRPPRHLLVRPQQRPVLCQLEEDHPDGDQCDHSGDCLHDSKFNRYHRMDTSLTDSSADWVCTCRARRSTKARPRLAGRAPIMLISGTQEVPLFSIVCRLLCI